MNNVAEHPTWDSSTRYFEGVGSRIRFMALHAALRAFLDYLGRVLGYINRTVIPECEYSMGIARVRWNRSRAGQYSRPPGMLSDALDVALSQSSGDVGSGYKPPALNAPPPTPVVNNRGNRSAARQPTLHQTHPTRGAPAYLWAGLSGLHTRRATRGRPTAPCSRLHCSACCRMLRVVQDTTPTCECRGLSMGHGQQPLYDGTGGHRRTTCGCRARKQAYCDCCQRGPVPRAPHGVRHDPRLSCPLCLT